eukprot:352901-Chlamydomonas_euryale.AAC.13
MERAKPMACLHAPRTITSFGMTPYAHAWIYVRSSGEWFEPAHVGPLLNKTAHIGALGRARH